MLHEKIANEIARFFLLHLKEELKKPSEIMDKVEFDNKTPRQINEEIIEHMKLDFPQVFHQPEAPYNFMPKWYKLNNFIYEYDEFAIDAYNIIFYQRLLHIKNWSKEAHKHFHKATLEVFGKFNYQQDGFSVSFFIRAENNMRELLREIITGIKGIDQKDAWDLIFQQSKDYQEVVNEFFENILNESLKRSDDLLLNILPVKVSNELKQKKKVEPVYIESATVLFTDFKGFTSISETLKPWQLVAELDECFSIFDNIIEKYGLEKIKTIGDSYMCAAGLPEPNNTHVVSTALVALEMMCEFEKLKSRKKEQGMEYWDIRIGFHTGPLVAGVIGHKKFSYDIWGDTVNTASRMESSGEPGKINTSMQVYSCLKNIFDFEHRGMLKVKGKDNLEMFFLKRIKKEYAKDNEGFYPQKILMHQGPGFFG